MVTPVDKHTDLPQVRQSEDPSVTGDHGEGLFHAVFHSARDAMLLADDEARYIEVNPAACELLGRSRDEILTMSVFDVSPEGVDAEAAWRAFLDSGEMEGEYRLVRPDGDTVEVEFRATANILPGVHLSVLRDVSDRVAIQQELQRARRLESLGVLAAGVAHDFNTMMATVRGHAELLRADHGSEEHPSLAAIDAAVDRAMDVTGRLLAFGRRQDLDLRTVHVNEIVEQARPLLGPLLEPKIDLVLDLTRDADARVVVDAQVEQVLLNLVNNARDAMPHGGSLTIATGVREVDEESSSLDVSPGRYVMIEVADDGMGMDSGTRERALDPFFTTKENWSPSGLGLSTAYGIVTQLGGSITIDSTPGAGTVVTLLLPMAATSATTDPTAP
jgi:two-component system, cell cycle sensor histidine kinase and response regulator CckA